MYDSALVYQQKTMETYSIKTSDNCAFLRIGLAKYYIFNEQAALAKPHLQIAQSLKKRPLTQAQAYHVQTLFLSKIGHTQAAMKEFASCDSLVEAMLTQTNNIATNQTIAEQAQIFYEDAINMKGLSPVLRACYKSLIDHIQQSKLSVPVLRTSSTNWSWYAWLALVVLLVSGLGGGWFWWHRGNPTLDEDAHIYLLRGEQGLIEQLDAKLDEPLDMKQRYMVLIYYREQNFSATARVLGIARNTLLAHMDKLSAVAGVPSVRDFIDHYRQQVLQDFKKNQKNDASQSQPGAA